MWDNRGSRAQAYSLVLCVSRVRSYPFLWVAGVVLAVTLVLLPPLLPPHPTPTLSTPFPLAPFTCVKASPSASSLSPSTSRLFSSQERRSPSNSRATAGSNTRPRT